MLPEVEGPRPAPLGTESSAIPGLRALGSLSHAAAEVGQGAAAVQQVRVVEQSGSPKVTVAKSGGTVAPGSTRTVADPKVWATSRHSATLHGLSSSSELSAAVESHGILLQTVPDTLGRAGHA